MHCVSCVCAHMHVHGLACVLKVCDVSSPGCLMWGDRDQRGKNGFTALRMWQPLSSVWQWVDMTKCFMKTKPRWTTTLRLTLHRLDSLDTHITTFKGKLVQKALVYFYLCICYLFSKTICWLSTWCWSESPKSIYQFNIYIKKNTVYIFVMGPARLLRASVKPRSPAWKAGALTRRHQSLVRLLRSGEWGLPAQHLLAGLGFTHTHTHTHIYTHRFIYRFIMVYIIYIL